MAYILEKIGNTYNLPKKYFTCDAKSDLDGISLVDVPIGSEAYCILEEENYILDSNKQWHKKKIGEDLTEQGQADLSQTDSTQADYVKGIIRPESLPEGYPYKGMEAILDGIFEFADSNGLYVYQIADENFVYIDGESYSVIWDGEAYRRVATTFNNIPILGNLAIAGAGADTGEPFLFIDYGNGQKIISTKDTSATHKVTVGVETIHPIAQELLPEIAIENGIILKNIQAVMPSSIKWLSIAYGNGKFVAMAKNSTKAAYSEDGITWTSTTSPNSDFWESVTYGNGKFVAVAYRSKRAAYSEDGINWTEATMPISADWNSVTYGNGKFVAVAENTTAAAYSEDGITWTAARMPSNNRWYSVTYGNGKFVAVIITSNQAAYSEDGINWTISSMPSIGNWSSITYGNGKFVAIESTDAAYSKAAYSEDGINWTETTMPSDILPSDVFWDSVTYGNGKFVAVTNVFDGSTTFGSTAAAYSEDGITWVATTMPSSALWTSVIYGNDKFVSIAFKSDKLAYSKDGITWHDSFTYISQDGEDVTTDTLIALDHTHDQYATKTELATKADSAELKFLQDSIVQSDLSQTDSTQIDYIKGVIRQESLPEGYPYREIETILDGTFEFKDSGGIYAHLITDENFAYTDGKSYTIIWDGVTYQCVATTFNSIPALGNLAVASAGADTGEPFLFVDQGNNRKLIGTLDTSATHTISVYEETICPIVSEFIPEIARGMVLKNIQTVMPSSKPWSSITYGNGKFVAVEHSSNIAAYSEDGINWIETSMPSSGDWTSITYGNGKFVAVVKNSTTAAYSDNGINWTETTMPSSEDWNSVTYGNGKFVAVAVNTTAAAYSEDGVNWAATAMPISEFWHSVTYGNGKFVAVANDSDKAAYSADGITWAATTMPSSITWSSVTYGNGKFVSVAYNSDKATYSEDGITWTSATMPSSVRWSSVIYSNGKFVAVANESDKAAYSGDGITWTETILPSSTYWQSVTYGNDKFIVVAYGTMVAYSEDGITWHDSIQYLSQNNSNITEDVRSAIGIPAYSTANNGQFLRVTDGIPTWTESLPTLTSPNGTKYQLTVSDDGTLSTVVVS